jgi:hypothetical protein
MPVLQNDHLRAENCQSRGRAHPTPGLSWSGFLWNGDPTWLNGRAPILFPIVGKVGNDKIVVDGKGYQHGFARTSEFTVTRADETEFCPGPRSGLRNPRAVPVRLHPGHPTRMGGRSLLTEATVWNVDYRPMPIDRPCEIG